MNAIKLPSVLLLLHLLKTVKTPPDDIISRRHQITSEFFRVITRLRDVEEV